MRSFSFKNTLIFYCEIKTKSTVSASFRPSSPAIDNYMTPVLKKWYSFLVIHKPPTEFENWDISFNFYSILKFLSLMERALVDKPLGLIFF